MKWAPINIEADRWVRCFRTITFADFDFTGATFAAQIRLTPDATGDPLVDLATVSTSAQGVRLLYANTDSVADHIVAGRLSAVPPGLDLTTDLFVSQIRLQINETTMEGLPFPEERGENVPLAWDLHVTPAVGAKDKYAGGTFTVVGGATE